MPPDMLILPAAPLQTNPVTRVSVVMGWRLDLINKLTPPAAAAQHIYYCGNRNGSGVRCWGDGLVCGQ